MKARGRSTRSEPAEPRLCAEKGGHVLPVRSISSLITGAGRTKFSYTPSPSLSLFLLSKGSSYTARGVAPPARARPPIPPNPNPPIATMAPRQDCAVVVADVRRTASDASYRHVLGIARAICLNRLLYGGKGAHVALVLFGTAGSRNDLCDELGGDGQYANITTARVMSPADASLVTCLDERSIERGPRSDFIDALVVALDIHRKDELKASRSIVVVSDFLDPVSPPDAEFLEVVLQYPREEGIRIELVSLSAPHAMPAGNAAVISSLRKDWSVFWEEAHDPAVTAAMRQIKQFKPQALSNQSLTLGALDIPVTVYKKVVQTRAGSHLKSDNFVRNDAEGATAPEYFVLKRETEYRKVPTPSEAAAEAGGGGPGPASSSGASRGSVVDKADMIKAYPYGKEWVPVSADVEKLLKEQTAKAIDVVGFAEREDLPSFPFLGDAYAVFPEKDNGGAQEAVSALVRALSDLDHVGIAKCVTRANSSAFLGALVPWPAPAPGVPDGFVLKVLPFAEDVRDYEFPSLNASSKWVPSDHELSLVEDVIGAMDLDNPPGGERAGGIMAGILPRVGPEVLPNPTMHRIHQFLLRKLMGAGERGKGKEGVGVSLDSCDEVVAAFRGPAPAVAARAEGALRRLEVGFGVVKTKKAKKTEEGENANGGPTVKKEEGSATIKQEAKFM